MAEKSIPKKARGFASMSLERRREIAAKGGKAVPAAKRTFSTDVTIAAAAGSKGGKAVPAEKRSFSKDLALAKAAGRKGGATSQGKKPPTEEG